ncbi:DNA mismatch repair endonuclease MutL [Senegalia massiliensis]|uniref:DNA mismatch repair endonuclease MutL n=1 Tax=Senegalia massiliensis TaxID=1720316 RepID=UPI001030252A|nr:DNA mismatch repair endonuclease MutL [Senegalia massiliensis]
MKKINVLDDNTINKIAAGEVIERPSSIVKELIENSIDANARNITIEIKDGGKNYIRITDDGDGIYKDDIQLAFLRHSTSKISKSEDLLKIHSLGFRGEALASISSISMVELISKTIDEETGIMVEIHGGVLQQESEVGAPKGTTIIVRNIFYNTPVRKKFLKSDSAESANITNIINKLALSNTDISFNYIKDNKNMIKTPGNGDLKSTIFSIYGKEHTESLISINYSSDLFSIDGYISKPLFNRGNRNYELFFVNGRYVNSKLLSKAIEEAYKTLITINRYPVVYLYIKVDPKNIDVNVHPSKVEIRFNDDLKLIPKITDIVKNRLFEFNLVPNITLDNKNKQKTEEIIDIVDEKPKNTETNNNNYNKPLFKKEYEVEDIEQINFVKEDKIETLDRSSVRENKKSIQNNDSSRVFPELNIIGRVFNTYIIGEDSISNTMYMIDQHAAHERIMYEKFRLQYEKESVVIQPLIVPRTINLNHYDYELILNNIELFNALGFDIEDFGRNSISIRGVPMLFGLPDNNNLFMDILDNLNENISNRYDLRAEKIIKMSCTNAIKAGDSMGHIEIKSLMNDLKKCENPFTCPHGRPITIKITKYEIEKMFKRIQ